MFNARGLRRAAERTDLNQRLTVGSRWLSPPSLLHDERGDRCSA